MFTSQMPVPKQQLFGNAGLPLVAGDLFTYAAGTTTPKATYTDSAGTIPQPNPIPLNARGEPTAPIFWSGDYYVEVRDSLGNLIYSVDDFRTPVTHAELIDDSGAGIIGFDETDVYPAGTVGRWLVDLITGVGSSFMGWIQAGIGAVLQTVFQKFRSQPVSVFDFLSDAKRATLLAGVQTDVTIELQAALDSFTTFGTVEAFGKMKITDTIYMKRTGMRLIGRGIGNTYIEYVNAAGGTAIAGHVTDSVTITDCEISGFYLYGSDAGTSPDICLDITTMAYSRFDLSIQTRRVNGTCIYGAGNSGSSPYYNNIRGYWFGGNDRTQTGLHFAQGAWPGGSNGPNANEIGPIHRAANLANMCKIDSGNGNIFHEIGGESIADYYFKLNDNPAVITGTSTGSNTMSSLINTTAAWVVNDYVGHAVKITSGAGLNQVRRIKNNTATVLNIDNPWGILPDATSSYSIFKGHAAANKFIGLRAEGISTENPDYIYAAPGTHNNSLLNSAVDSLGAGLVVRDESGSPSNVWTDGHKVIFTEYITNPGPGYSQDIYPRNSVFGGVMLTNYCIEWMSVAINALTPGGTATVKLDAGGTAAGNGDMTLTIVAANVDIGFAMPGSTEKIKRDGQNKHVFLNVATDGSFSATADIVVTWCATIDL